MAPPLGQRFPTSSAAALYSSAPPSRARARIARASVSLAVVTSSAATPSRARIARASGSLAVVTYSAAAPSRALTARSSASLAVVKIATPGYGAAPRLRHAVVAHAERESSSISEPPPPAAEPLPSSSVKQNKDNSQMGTKFVLSLIMVCLNKALNSEVVSGWISTNLKVPKTVASIISLMLLVASISFEILKNAKEVAEVAEYLQTLLKKDDLTDQSK